MLSIVVPTRLPADRPLRTLKGLGQQDIGLVEMEVVIVTDGVAPETAEALRRLPVPFSMRVIEQPWRGQAAARNRGASATSGEWILFLDDDLDPAPDFLRQVVRHLLDGVDVVLPELRIGAWVPDTLPVLVARRLERTASEARRRGAPLVFEDIVFAATAIRRTAFEQAGGFDEAFTAGGAYGNEDIELGYRLVQAGAHVARASDAIVSTDFPPELSTLLHRARDVGRNDVRLARKHPALAEPLFGRKLVYSRTHRLVGPAVLRLPSLARGAMLLRWPVRWWVHRHGEGPVRTRLWFALRSVWYWRGVAEAGGRPLALGGRAALRADLGAREPPSPPGGPSGAQPPGR